MGKIGVGVIGLGFMGSTHFRIYQAMENAHVVALADVDAAKRKGDISKVVGNIGSTVSADRIERISSNDFKAAARQAPTLGYRVEDPAIRDRKLNFRMELDVRGERLSDALDNVTHYVDDALMLSVPSVRIIHGKGTGVLREEIQKYLRTIPGIASVKDEQIQFGGTGVTIVTFD